jgi:hypothetical protein
MGSRADGSLREALVSGSAASVVSSLALAWCGRRESCDAAGPLNGLSRWVWGGSAPYARGFSLRHTVVGYEDAGRARDARGRGEHRGHGARAPALG